MTKERVLLEIAAVATSMVEGRLDLLDGCRTIVRLRGALPEAEMFDPDLLVLVAVESELDDVPSGSTREHWAMAALAEKDKDKAEYLGVAKQEIIDACRGLIARWSGPA